MEPDKMQKLTVKIFIIGLAAIIAILAICMFAFSPNFSVDTTIVSNPIASFRSTQFILKYDKPEYNPIPVYTDITVQAMPGTLGYSFSRLTERFDLFTHRYNQLFFASKRIAELQKWGNEMDWNKTMDLYAQNIKDYVYHIKQESRRGPDFPMLYSTLRAQQATLEQLIFQQSGDIENNIKKVKKIDTLYHDLYALIPQQYVIPQGGAYYPIQSIITEREWGIFDITAIVDPNISDSDLNKIRLTVDRNDYYPSTVSRQNNGTQLSFANIVIGKSQKALSLFLHLPPLEYHPTSWTEDGSRYSTEIILPKSIRKFVVRTDSNLPVPVDFKLEEHVFIPGKNYRTDTVYERRLFPHGSTHTTEDEIDLTDNKKILGYYLVIESPRQLSPEELDGFSFTLTPTAPSEILADMKSPLAGLQPKVNISKINKTVYKITTTDTTQFQDQSLLNSIGNGWSVIAGPQRNNQYEYIVRYSALSGWNMLIILLVSILLITILFTQKWFCYFKRPIHIPVDRLLKRADYFCLKTRSVLLIITLGGILYDLFVIKNISTGFIFILTFAALGALIGYRAESRINFLIALMLFVLCPFYLIIHREFVGEKIAIWAYIFLAIGSVQFVVEMKKKPIRPAKTYMDFLNQLVSILFRIVRQISDPALYILSLIIKKTFITQPKTAVDYLSNIVRIILILILFSFSTYYGINKAIEYNRYLTVERMKKERLTLNPTISKIEPYIVYRSTKVVITGDNFGWRQPPGAALLANHNIPISVDLWTNSKIIFTVPLDWQPGAVSLLVAKPIEWQNRKEIAESNDGSIKLIPVTGKFTPADDAYFAQLKHLDREVLTINGYASDYQPKPIRKESLYDILINAIKRIL